VPDGLPGPDELAALTALRAMTRRLLAPGGDPWSDEARALLASAAYGVDATGRIGDLRAGWPGFCRDLLLPLLALVTDGVVLHACANPACRLVFQDGSRNHGRRWCDTAGCGNRARVRRARRAAHTPRIKNGRNGTGPSGRDAPR